MVETKSNHDDGGEWLQVHFAAKAAERRSMVRSLPIKPGARILDVGAGAGLWNSEFRSYAPNCRIVAMDIASEALKQNDADECIVGDLNDFPEMDQTFDLIWFANALMYARDPSETLRQARQLMAPNAVLAAKEEDSGRDILLPWTEEIDLRVKAAWHKISSSSSTKSFFPYLGRTLTRHLHMSGFELVRVQTYPCDRVFPFDPTVIEYVSRAFLDYRDDYKAHLEPNVFKSLIDTLDPDSAGSIWHAKDAHLVFLESVVVARSNNLNAV